MVMSPWCSCLACVTTGRSQIRQKAEVVPAGFKCSVCPIDQPQLCGNTLCFSVSILLFPKVRILEIHPVEGTSDVCIESSGLCLEVLNIGYISRQCDW